MRVSECGFSRIHTVESLSLLPSLARVCAEEEECVWTHDMRWHS